LLYKNKKYYGENNIFSLIVNFYCVSRNANLSQKATVQTSKQAGLSAIDKIYYEETLKKLVFFY
jgi:hypothetical protein